jgi:hypothetical protein
LAKKQLIKTRKEGLAGNVINVLRSVHLVESKNLEDFPDIEVKRPLKYYDKQ